jgi:hypothetical protein
MRYDELSIQVSVNQTFPCRFRKRIQLGDCELMPNPEIRVVGENRMIGRFKKCSELRDDERRTQGKKPSIGQKLKSGVEVFGEYIQIMDMKILRFWKMNSASRTLVPGKCPLDFVDVHRRGRAADHLGLFGLLFTVPTDMDRVIH